MEAFRELSNFVSDGQDEDSDSTKPTDGLPGTIVLSLRTEFDKLTERLSITECATTPTAIGVICVICGFFNLWTTL